MPRLVRRRPLWERITSNLNPMDFLLWLSEELETRDWDSKLVGTQLGLGMNVIFLLARANSGSSSSLSDNDIFGDEAQLGFFSYVVSSGKVIATCRARCTNRLGQGVSHYLGPHVLLVRQRGVCLHANAEIPNVRGQHRTASVNALCAPSSGPVVSHVIVLLTATIPRRQDRTGLC
jgi:hypothetical protein